jgi:hypothetical protein
MDPLPAYSELSATEWRAQAMEMTIAALIALESGTIPISKSSWSHMDAAVTDVEGNHFYLACLSAAAVLEQKGWIVTGNWQPKSPFPSIAEFRTRLGRLINSNS